MKISDRPRGEAHVFRDMGLGDVLMCTPAMRALKRADPDIQIFFYTDLPAVVRGLSYIDHVLPSEQRPPHAIYMSYDVPPPAGHLGMQLGGKLGVAVDDARPDCVVEPVLVDRFRAQWRDLPRPIIVVQRLAGWWTTNKNWPNKNWHRLLARLAMNVTIVEIGEFAVEAGEPAYPHYFDLRGRTNLSELAACIAAADILVGPVSGPTHIAAAVRTPAVIILGGYEVADNAHYEGNRTLALTLPCSPCWLRTPCPIDRACLRGIDPETVEQSIRDVWGTGR